MGMFDVMNISASGLSAQRMRMDVISNNIANAHSTRTTEGGPYRRRRVIMTPIDDNIRWRSPILPQSFKHRVGRGVRVVRIEKDMSPLRLVYDPNHPDAIKFGVKKGYVQYPNVNIVTEMVDLISATRSYEANVTMIQTEKQIFNKALEINR